MNIQAVALIFLLHKIINVLYNYIGLDLCIFFLYNVHQWIMHINSRNLSKKKKKSRCHFIFTFACFLAKSYLNIVFFLNAEYKDTYSERPRIPLQIWGKVPRSNGAEISSYWLPKGVFWIIQVRWHCLFIYLAEPNKWQQAVAVFPHK